MTDTEGSNTASMHDFVDRMQGVLEELKDFDKTREIEMKQHKTDSVQSDEFVDELLLELEHVDEDDDESECHDNECKWNRNIEAIQTEQMCISQQQIEHLRMYHKEC